MACTSRRRSEKSGQRCECTGRLRAQRTEMLRFDDFVDAPHYHVPADGSPIMFDRATLGEPLGWFVGQLRDHLGELLTTAGFAEVLAVVDLGAVADNVDNIRKSMADCLPDGYVRVPGVGLQRAPLSSTL